MPLKASVEERIRKTSLGAMLEPEYKRSRQMREHFREKPTHWRTRRCRRIGIHMVTERVCLLGFQAGREDPEGLGGDVDKFELYPTVVT